MTNRNTITINMDDHTVQALATVRAMLKRDTLREVNESTAIATALKAYAGRKA